MILTMKVREHNFMGEQRGPFIGGGTVGIGAAEEFMLAVGPANQLGVAELADDMVAVALRDEVYQFHTLQLYERHLDIGGLGEKIVPIFLHHPRWGQSASTVPLKSGKPYETES